LVATAFDGACVVVYDAAGMVFDRLRTVALGLPMRRIRDGVVEYPGRRDLAIVAAYDRPDWTTAGRLASELSTVLVTTRADHGHAVKALTLGLMGCLDVDLPDHTLRRALRAVIGGEAAFARAALGRWIRLQRSGVRLVRGSLLTPRQHEVATLIATGAADKEIAAALGITTATAQKHVANILERLGVPNRAAAVAALSTREVLT
jgi:DNA-binding NarL/FixJ family response regulator